MDFLTKRVGQQWYPLIIYMPMDLPSTLKCGESPNINPDAPVISMLLQPVYWLDFKNK